MLDCLKRVGGLRGPPKESMKRPVLTVLVVVLAVVLAWFSFLAWRAHSNLVTLDVRNMEVREVVRKIEWQTWELILVQKGVEGKVTLKVKKMPLNDVMAIVSDQTSSRFSAYYPLYSSSKSLKNFKQALRGELSPAQHGWTALQPRGFGFGGRGGPGFGGGMFGGGGVPNQTKLVTLNIFDKDLDFATTALGRFGEARVVAEDGTKGNVKVSVTQVPMEKAVAAVAKQVKREWSEYYALTSFRRFRPTNELAEGDGPPAGDRDRGFGRRRDRDLGDGTNEFASFRERQREIELATMTPDQIKAAEERRKTFEEMSQLSDEERRQRFEQMRANNPNWGRDRDNRMLNSVKNLTPEQRVDRYRPIAERRLRGDQGGRGGPGGGGFRGGR